MPCKQPLIFLINITYGIIVLGPFFSCLCSASAFSFQFYFSLLIWLSLHLLFSFYFKCCINQLPFYFCSFCCIGGLLVICLSRMSIPVSVVVFLQVILLSFLLDFSCFSSSLGSVIKCYVIACYLILCANRSPWCKPL